MPVNMDPKKRRRPAASPADQPDATDQPSDELASPTFGQETEADREKELADAEWKNLWEATEVIDMDKW